MAKSREDFGFVEMAMANLDSPSEEMDIRRESRERLLIDVREAVIKELRERPDVPYFGDKWYRLSLGASRMVCFPEDYPEDHVIEDFESLLREVVEDLMQRGVIKDF